MRVEGRNRIYVVQGVVYLFGFFGGVCAALSTQDVHVARLRVRGMSLGKTLAMQVLINGVRVIWVNAFRKMNPHDA
jgi:hypothetical protein